MPFIAYKITHKESGKAYVGVTTKTVAHRWSRHLVMAGRKGQCNAMARAILKYGAQAFDVIELAYAFSKADMLEMERILIVQENTRPPFGYNLTSGGEGVFDLSQEARDRLSVALRGKPKSAECRAKIAAFSPKRLTPEVRARISLKLTGRPTGRKPSEANSERLRQLNQSRSGVSLTPEHKAAIARGQTGMKRPDGTGEKIAATKRGKPRSEETKAKIAATRLLRYGNKRPGHIYEESVSS